MKKSEDTIPHEDENRRAVAGFARAIAPVRTHIVATDAAGLSTRLAQIPVRDGTLPAFEARPAAEARYPVVLVIHEIFGVHEHIRDICRRLAKLGYWAIAPDLFARLGDAAKVADAGEIMSQLVGRTPDSQILSDLDATLAWAEQSANCDDTKLAITGFCWGGRITWLYCAHNPSLTAGVAWYGRLENTASVLQPRHPLDLAPELRVPVLGLYGGADASIPRDSIERMRAALKRGGSGSEIVVYPEAPHAFFADYRPNYRQDAAQDGWARLCRWFAAHGVA